MIKRLREPINGFTHLTGAILSAIGLVVLVVLSQHQPARLAAVIVYGISLILLYTASTVYHLVNAGERVLRWLRSLDHAAIYILIAGTYTPFCVSLLPDPWRAVMLVVIWGLAAAGVIYKLAFRHHNHRYVSTTLYLGMGWLAVLILPAMLQHLPAGALILIVSGGLVYTLGALIYALKRPNLGRRFGHHELWHLLVMGGSALHYAAVALYAV